MADGRLESDSAGRRIGAAALLLSASVLLSRVLGFVRDMLLAHSVGAGPSGDAYYAGFQIPDLLNHLLAGGAMSIAFVPLYTRHVARGDEDEAQRLFSTVLGTLTAATVLAAVILHALAEPLTALQFGSFDADTQRLTVRLTRIVLPAQIFFIAGGVINAVLLARGRFGAAAVAPLLYNLGIIAGGLLLAPLADDPAEGFSWGALAGAVLGPFLAPLWDSRFRVRVRLRVAPFDPRFTGYLRLAAPLMIGQSLLTVDEWYSRWFGATVAEGSVAHLSYARRLMLLPVAVVGQSIAAAALPYLSRLHAEGKDDQLNVVQQRTLQAGLSLGALLAAATAALADPIVRVVYQRGRFDAADAEVVSTLLVWMALAIPVWIVQQIGVRAFYARGDTWRPMVAGTVVAALAVPVYWAGARFAGVEGIAGAGLVSMGINAVVTLVWAVRLHGGPDLAVLLSSLGRSALIGAAAAVPALLAVAIVPAHSLAGSLTAIAAGGALFGVVAGLGVVLVGDDVLREILRRILARLRIVRSSDRGGSNPPA